MCSGNGHYPSWFPLAATHGLSVCAADVGNAFLYGKTREKVYVIAGPEFGEHAGKRMIIDRGLYGLKSSAARFHEHFCLQSCVLLGLRHQPPIRTSG